MKISLSSFIFIVLMAIFVVISGLSFYGYLAVGHFRQAEKLEPKVTFVPEYRCKKCHTKTSLGTISNIHPGAQDDNYKNYRNEIVSIQKDRYLPRIETKRLILRTATFDDLDDIYEWRSKPEVSQSTVFDLDKTKEDTYKTIEKWHKAYKKLEVAPFVLELKENKKVIGSAGFTAMYGSGETVVIGYVIDSNYWGRGFATEAARALIEFGMTVMQANRVQAVTRMDNSASLKVMFKAGMSYEGLNRESWKVKGEMLSIHMSAVIKRDIKKVLDKSVIHAFLASLN